MKKRLNAEWEPQLATIMAMPHKDSDWKPYLREAQNKVSEIATQIARFQSVIMLYKYENDVKKLKENLRGNQNIHFVNIATNDTWCRDFSPICLTSDVAKNADKNSADSSLSVDSNYIMDSKNSAKKSTLFVLDFIFNAWGAKFASNLDNLANKALFESGILQKLSKNAKNTKSVKFREIDFILEGGSIECNGDSTLLTTTNCLLSPNRNRKSKSEIEKSLKKYLKIKKVLWLENGFLAGDDTDSHIDNLARFVDKNTIVYVKCEDKRDIHFEVLSAMEAELKALKNKDKASFHLVSLPLPEPIYYDGVRLPASYVNFVFVNGAILVPTFGESNKKFGAKLGKKAASLSAADKKALEIFAKLFPKREIIPIDSRILVRQGGGMHCLSMQIPK